MIKKEVFKEVLQEYAAHTIIRETLSTRHMFGTPEHVLPSLLDDLASLHFLEALRNKIDSQIATVTASAPPTYYTSQTIN